MRRMLWAGLLALPIMLATADAANAQGCSSCGPLAGVGRPNGWTGTPGPFGSAGFCMKFFGTWHQNGPLVNYGPYEGYYPFTPYGPWTSDLRYTGPSHRFPTGTGYSEPIGNRLLGLVNQRPRFGEYAMNTFRNVFARVQPCSKGCGF
jgi:hypothetical protein